MGSIIPPIIPKPPSASCAFRHLDPHQLAEFERGIIRERTVAGLEAAKARGRTGGRPPALTEDDLTAAKAMLKVNGISVAEVAARLNVAPSTLYRHLPGGRGAVARYQ